MNLWQLKATIKKKRPELFANVYILNSGLGYKNTIHKNIYNPSNLPASLFLDFTFGSTSTSSVSRGKLSGRIKYRMLFPRILSVSNCTGSRFFRVIFTALRCVFMLTSTPKKKKKRAIISTIRQPIMLPSYQVTVNILQEYRSATLQVSMT